MTALTTPVCDVSMALRVNHDKTQAALVQVKLRHTLMLDCLQHVNTVGHRLEELLHIHLSSFTDISVK